MKIAVDMIASEMDHSQELRASCGPHILHVGAGRWNTLKVPFHLSFCLPCILRQCLSLA